MVALMPLMERTSGRCEITIGLIDGPVAKGHTEFENQNIRELPGASYRRVLPPSVSQRAAAQEQGLGVGDRRFGYGTYICRKMVLNVACSSSPISGYEAHRNSRTSHAFIYYFTQNQIHLPANNHSNLEAIRHGTFILPRLPELETNFAHAILLRVHHDFAIAASPEGRTGSGHKTPFIDRQKALRDRIHCPAIARGWILRKTNGDRFSERQFNGLAVIQRVQGHCG
jgi:hypothetical protein